MMFRWLVGTLVAIALLLPGPVLAGGHCGNLNEQPVRSHAINNFMEKWGATQEVATKIHEALYPLVERSADCGLYLQVMQQEGDVITVAIFVNVGGVQGQVGEITIKGPPPLVLLKARIGTWEWELPSPMKIPTAGKGAA
jgi:hypothetical protein